MKITRTPDGWRLEMVQRLPLSPEALFPFFGDARNLEAITPSWLKFEVLTSGEIEMKPGALIDYRLKVRGLPLGWRTKIVVWEPPHRFVDEQIKGPYKKWYHEHTFEAMEDGGTLATDRVDYALYGGPLGLVMNKLMIERDVRTIFRHRTEKLREKFGGPGEVEHTGVGGVAPVTG